MKNKKPRTPVYRLCTVKENGTVILGGAAFHVSSIEFIEGDFFDINDKEIQAVKVSLKSGKSYFIRERIVMEDPQDEDSYQITVFPAILDRFSYYSNK